MARQLLQRLALGRSSLPQSVKNALQLPDQPPQRLVPSRKWRRRQPTYLKGVVNGNYFRLKIPPKKQPVPKIPKLPPTNPMPKPLTPPPPLTKVSPESPLSYQIYTRRLLGWLRSNGPVLILNFGSICTLVGFTRSDVLELRSLAMTGNFMFVMYVLQQNTILWASVGWSSLFATVNAWKIMQILHERTAEVHMSEEEEQIFVAHFMSHGVTPKQYERIERKSKTLKFSKGDILVRSGELLDHVYLITQGSTKALALGRFVTAASTNPDTKGDKKAGGDSGAWVGEMVFLDQLWTIEQGKNPEEMETPEKGQKKKAGAAIYTVVCDEDCTVMAWSHEDMAELMQSSNDLRSAMTRAMTSALVGKVVNLTVSRTQRGLPSWTDWLSDWRNNDGTKVTLRGVSRLAEDNGTPNSTESEEASGKDASSPLPSIGA